MHIIDFVLVPGYFPFFQFYLDLWFSVPVPNIFFNLACLFWSLFCNKIQNTVNFFYYTIQSYCYELLNLPLLSTLCSVSKIVKKTFVSKFLWFWYLFFSLLRSPKSFILLRLLLISLLCNFQHCCLLHTSHCSLILLPLHIIAINFPLYQAITLSQRLQCALQTWTWIGYWKQLFLYAGHLRMHW